MMVYPQRNHLPSHPYGLFSAIPHQTATCYLAGTRRSHLLCLAPKILVYHWQMLTLVSIDAMVDYNREYTFTKKFTDIFFGKSPDNIFWQTNTKLTPAAKIVFVAGGFLVFAQFI
jgi:hypothetical protein